MFSEFSVEDGFLARGKNESWFSNAFRAAAAPKEARRSTGGSGATSDARKKPLKLWV